MCVCVCVCVLYACVYMQCVYSSLPIWCCYAVLHSQLSNSSNKPVVCCLIHTHIYTQICTHWRMNTHTHTHTHTHTYTVNTNLYTHASSRCYSSSKRKRPKNDHLFTLSCGAAATPPASTRREKKKRVKERNRGGSRKAKGRRTTEEDRGRSGGRTRNEWARRSHRLRARERVCWWMWSSELWFGPV